MGKLKSKKPRKPRKKPAKRKNARPQKRPHPKTAKKSKRTQRSPVKRATGRADGFLPQLRKHYDDARERLGRFYDENSDAIHTAGKVALGALGAGVLGYGGYRLYQKRQNDDQVADFLLRQAHKKDNEALDRLLTPREMTQDSRQRFFATTGIREETPPTTARHPQSGTNVRALARRGEVGDDDFWHAPVSTREVRYEDGTDPEEWGRRQQLPGGAIAMAEAKESKRRLNVINARKRYLEQLLQSAPN